MTPEVWMTLQQAADMLNVSRPYFVRLLEHGDIAFTDVERHRRVRYQDVLAYMKQADERSRRAKSALTEQAQALRMGY